MSVPLSTAPPLTSKTPPREPTPPSIEVTPTMPCIFAAPVQDATGDASWRQISTPTAPSLLPSTPISIITWNIDTFAYHSGARMEAILGHISFTLPSPPSHTIVLFQEVDWESHVVLFRNEWIRENFQISHLESPESVRYFTVSLATRDVPVIAVRRVPYERTQMGRDVLFLDVALQGDPSILRVGNTHLESLPHPGVRFRPVQLAMAAEMMKEGDIRAGVIAGDMNAICPEDDDFPKSCGLGDVWELQKGTEETEGYTWGYQPPCRFSPGRLDKVLFRGDFAFDEVEEGRLLRRIGVGLRFEEPTGEVSDGSKGDDDDGGDDDDTTEWASDHYGLWVKVRLSRKGSGDMRGRD